ncbi:MAG: hypothetical protein GF364_01565 [Candidatus Lokiarchaeota archaeon]|nr:hypothetical protein [Candidatus Lokiarchaeota archaeon]
MSIDEEEINLASFVKKNNVTETRESLNDLFKSFSLSLPIINISLYSSQGFHIHSMKDLNAIHDEVAPFLSGVYNLSISFQENLLQGDSIKLIQFYGEKNNIYVFKVNLELILVLETRDLRDIAEGLFDIQIRNLIMRVRKLLVDGGN